jgi:hypothetical protein
MVIAYFLLYLLTLISPHYYRVCFSHLLSFGTGAAGGSRLVMPPEAGILLTNQNKYLIMETHYDNSALATDSVDESGVTIYYADKLRSQEAGILITGDTVVSLIGTPVVSGKKYMFSCPSECTEMFKEPVNVFAGFLHMHLTGQKIYENKFSKNGTFLEQISAVRVVGETIHSLLELSALADKYLPPQFVGRRANTFAG